jgi:hypothetical protein
VADHYALFWDGPCAKTTRKLDVTKYLSLGHYHMPDTLQCGGKTYIRGTPPDDLDPTYFVAGGKFAPGTRIVGESDVFRAWSQLHKALNNTVGRQRVRVATAGRRIRRAVR